MSEDLKKEMNDLNADIAKLQCKYVELLKDPKDAKIALLTTHEMTNKHARVDEIKKILDPTPIWRQNLKE